MTHELNTAMKLKDSEGTTFTHEGTLYTCKQFQKYYLYKIILLIYKHTTTTISGNIKNSIYSPSQCGSVAEHPSTD